MDAFQDRLKLIRGKLTQDDLSKLLDIHLVTYGRYERGERSPDGQFIEKICRVFNISPTWLILGEGPMRLDEALSDSARAASPASLDHELLRQIIAGVKQGLAIKNMSLPADKEAELITLLYDHYYKLKQTPDTETLERYLRLVA